MSTNNIYVPVEYVWIGGPDPNYTLAPLRYKKPFTLRNKGRVICTSKANLTLKDIPTWNYDGSSTGQAETNKSEVFLAPRAIFNNPFIEGGKMVLCDTYVDHECTVPHESNTRSPALGLFNKKPDEEPWFGIEQEFFLMCLEDGLPVGFDPLIPQGQYYCAAGSRNTFCRDLVEKMVRCALDAGIKVSGWNQEVAPGQWEIQIGPLTGIEAGDQLWMLRFIMEKVTENTPYYIELHPKPILFDTSQLDITKLKNKSGVDWKLPTEWNGSGAHTNYSTKAMREKGGMKVIKEAIDKLAATHKEHMKHYGEYNEFRLSGRCETSSIDRFTYGVADRTASVRIPTETAKKGYGYIEDRRPSSIMDPYKVTGMLFGTTCLI